MEKKYEKMSAADLIRTGLQQSIEYERGDKTKARSRKVSFDLAPNYSAAEIKSIRVNAGMTQVAFAAYFGVAKKTVESWEAGINKPTPPARRLMSVLSAAPDLALSLFKREA